MPPTRNHRLTNIGSILFNRDDLELMRELAARHDRTLSGEIRYAIGLYVQQHRQRGTLTARENKPPIQLDRAGNRAAMM